MRWKRPNESVEFIVELENVGIVRWLDELLEVVLKERERGVTISFELQFARRSTRAKRGQTNSDLSDDSREGMSKNSVGHGGRLCERSGFGSDSWDEFRVFEVRWRSGWRRRERGRERVSRLDPGVVRC